MRTEFKTLIFSVGEMRCGIQSDTVREVISEIDIIPIHDGPEFLSGAILRHERVLPLVDVRLLLGLKTPTEIDDQTCIIICKLPKNGAQADQANSGDEFDDEGLVGALIERLHETRRMAPDDVISPPNVAGTPCVTYLNGLTQQDGAITLLLNMPALLDVRSNGNAHEALTVDSLEAAQSSAEGVVN